MQAGVKMEMHGVGQPTPSHHDIQARIGVNSAMVEHGALVALLVKKGVITDEEYFSSLANMMEREVRRYEEKLTERSSGRVKVTLVGRLGSIHDEEIAS